MREINENELESLIQSKKILIIDFSATWCGPCKNLGKILETKFMPMISSKPDIEIVKIDIDKNKQISQAMQVLSVPTMMIFFRGKRVVFEGEKGPEDRIVGFVPTIDQILLELISQLEKAPEE